MNLQLTGKKVFISGSTAGIGFSIAELFLKEGAEVTINGRTSSSVKKAIELILGKNPDAIISGVYADFRKEDEIKRLIEKVSDVDILINNVGIYKSQSFEETTDNDWQDMFNVNIMSAVRLSRVYLPKMLNKNWGRIINISSECAHLVPNDLIAYSTTKTAMLGLSRGLAQLTKGTNVTVNCVLPGSTLSEGAAQFLKNQAHKENTTEQEVADNFFKKVRTSSLIQRFAKTNEIASTVVYLTSPLAAATNGTSIKVDGGSISGIN